ncbi:MAG: endonuclease/exonuclease/phosphatase family protein [Pseudomonadota bacterium]
MAARLRIGTWNVEYADNEATNARRREVMRRYPADIWILTETRDALSPGPDFAAVHSEPRPPYGQRASASGARWVSIWTRLPTLQRATVSDPERTVAALLETTLGPLTVYGTVMPWADDKGRMGEREDAKRWSEHHRVIPLQIADWLELRKTNPGVPLCVAGDFNTDMLTCASYGTRKGIEMLRGGLASVGLSCVTAELCAKSLVSPPIDHIALPTIWRSSLVAAWEGKAGSPRLSDHSGMVVEVEA